MARVTASLSTLQSLHYRAYGVLYSRLSGYHMLTDVKVNIAMVDMSVVIVNGAMLSHPFF
jgi:hypothetical protein